MKIVVRAKAQTPAETITVDPKCLRISTRPLRILDFDIENRPLTYLGSDFTTAEVTAIAWAWADQPSDVTVYLLGETDLSEILLHFVDAYNRADMVTGHYILGHDLPMLNGALVELGMPVLSDKLVSDTKVHLCSMKGISKSQESLGAMLDLKAPKVQMNQSKWRAANRLTPEGLQEVRQRVVGDVQQHLQMRAKLIQHGWLGAPRMWRSGSAKTEAYVP